MNKLSTALVLSSLALLPAGCNDRQESAATPQRHSSADAGANAAASAAQAPVALANAAAEGEPISWKLPKDWKIDPADKPMRYATLVTPERNELAVSVFPGTVGGTLANINRWRQQIDAKPVTEAELEKNLQHLDVNGADVLVTDIEGTENRRMLAAIFPDKGKLWFFKLTGTNEDVTKRKEDFIQLLKSVKLNPQAS